MKFIEVYVSARGTARNTFPLFSVKELLPLNPLTPFVLPAVAKMLKKKKKIHPATYVLKNRKSREWYQYEAVQRNQEVNRSNTYGIRS